MVAAAFTLLTGIFSAFYGTTANSQYQWVEGASIFFAAAFIALFASSCEYAKNKQILKLYEEIRNQEISVIRGQYGLSMQVKIDELVVGDIIMIETGMRVPADCILLDGMDITAEETIYNEGRYLVNKKEISKGDEHHRENPDPFLLTSSLILSGSGRAVVAAVGTHTRYTQQFNVEQLQDQEELTPLQERLEKLAGFIGKWGYLAGILIFLTMTIFLLLQIMFDEQRDLLSLDTLQTLLRYFTVGVAVVMVAVPEGLPLAISISMAFSIDTMKQDNLLIKKPDAPENLGYIREICTGKTATLTENNMTVNQYYVAGRTYDNRPNAEGVRPQFLNVESSSHISTNIIDVLKDSIIFNCESRIEMNEEGFYVPTGNGTEVAMLRFLQQNEIPAHELLIKRFREGEHECSIPFNSMRKRATTVIRPHKKCGYVRVIVKGAPEYVLPLCT